MFFQKCTFYFSTFSKAWYLPRNTTPLLRRLNLNVCHCRKRFSDSPKGRKEDEIPSAFSKYEFANETTHATLDVEEEREKVISRDDIYNEFEGVNLQRGVTGIFDIEELVDLLRKEKVEDVVVIKIPSEYRYADYMVIVNGRSTRHMLAVSDFVRRIYKKKVRTDVNIPKLEGKTSNTWMAIDLGNIVLHVFSKSGREMYDLETLWTVGKDFDTLTLEKDTSVALPTDHRKIFAHLTPKT